MIVNVDKKQVKEIFKKGKDRKNCGKMRIY